MIPCLNGATAGGGLPFPEFVQLAARTGFGAVEFGVESLVQLVQERSLAGAKDFLASSGVQLGAWGLPVEWRQDEATFRAGLDRLPDLARMAAEFGCFRTCTWIAPSSDVPYDERWAFVVGRLRPIVDILRAEDIHFGIEFVGPKTARTGPYGFMYTMAEALKMGEDLGGDHCGLLLDSFHWFCSETTADEIAALPAEKIVHVHINDAPDRPVAEQMDFERLLPGEGVIDLTAFLSALQRIGYSGPVSVETFSQELGKLPAEEAAVRASAAVRGVLSKVAG